jgi:hypothetical protein
MSMLSQHNCTLVASKPNANGLCTFQLMQNGEELAKIDEPTTLENALISARIFLEQEYADENEND